LGLLVCMSHGILCRISFRVKSPKRTLRSSVRLDRLTSDKPRYVALGVVARATGEAKPALVAAVTLVQQPDVFQWRKTSSTQFPHDRAIRYSLSNGFAQDYRTLLNY